MVAFFRFPDGVALSSSSSATEPRMTKDEVDARGRIGGIGYLPRPPSVGYADISPARGEIGRPQRPTSAQRLFEIRNQIIRILDAH
jgi:hypothetical protein